MQSSTDAEEYWNRFINHLTKIEPLGKEIVKKKSKGGRPFEEEKPKQHQNFLGSIAHYKKIFLEANS